MPNKRGRKTDVMQFIRPESCLTPNEVGERLGITGEAVKAWIRKGRLKAAKARNGYWWVRESDLQILLEARNQLEFRYHRSS